MELAESAGPQTLHVIDHSGGGDYNANFVHTAMSVYFNTLNYAFATTYQDFPTKNL